MARGNKSNHKRAGRNMADFLTIKRLREHFILDGDKLVWNPKRPRSHFSSDRSYHAYLTSCAGEEAGSSDVSIGGYKQSYILCDDGKRRLQYNHRIMWCLYHNQLIPAGMMVDHKDGDQSNNNPYNLRLVTPAVNARNRNPKPGQVIGAILIVGRNSSYYIVKVNGKRIDRNKYATKEEAGLARDRWIVAHGLDAQYRLNFPDVFAANSNSSPCEAAA